MQRDQIESQCQEQAETQKAMASELEVAAQALVAEKNNSALAVHEVSLAQARVAALQERRDQCIRHIHQFREALSLLRIFHVWERLSGRKRQARAAAKAAELELKLQQSEAKILHFKTGVCTNADAHDLLCAFFFQNWHKDRR